MTSNDATPPLPTSAWLRTTLAVALLLLLSPAWAAESPRRSFDLLAGAAAETLKQFSEQAGVAVVFATETSARARTNAVKGSYTTSEAIALLLKDSGLIAVPSEKTGTFTVIRDPNVARAAPPLATARPNPSAGDVNSEAIVLSPFEVVASDRGYFASNTTAGTRINSRIEDLGAAISVVNKEQMADFALLDINDIFAYEAGTEGTGNFTDFSFDVYGSPVDNVQLDPNNANRIRGLGAANITLGNFETSGRVPIDPLNIEGVEISRGPNSSIFGIGNTSGTVNSVPSSANLNRHRSQAAFRVDSVGGHRASLDLNRVLKPGVLAVRASAAFQHDGYERKPSGIDSVRLNGMLKYRPFAKTTLSASYSDYRMHGTRPNATAARDGVSGWLAAGAPTWDLYTRTAKLGGATLPYTGNFPAEYFWERPPSGGAGYSLIHVEQGGITFWGQALSGAQRYLSPLPMPGSPLQNQPLWGAFVNGVQQYTPPLTDKRIYDWTSLNLAANSRVRDDSGMWTVLLDQIFLDTPRHSLALQAGWFREANQTHEFVPIGMSTHLSQGAAVVTVDINERRRDGTPNPNFLRPYVAATAPRVRYGFVDRDTYRGQLVYKFDSRAERTVWRWLGMHQISGYAEYKRYEDWTRDYKYLILSNHTWLANLGPTTNRAVSPSYLPHFNFYLGDNAGYNVDYAASSFEPGIYPVLVNSPASGFVSEPVQLGLGTQGNGGTFTILKSRGAILQSHLLKDRLIMTVGWRHDERYSKSRVPLRLLDDRYTFDPASDRWADGTKGEGPTKTAGLVVKPLRWLSLYINTSDSFRPASPAQDVYRRVAPDPKGEGRDYGLMLSLLSGKLFVRLNEYRVEQNNDRNGSLGTVLSRALNQDFLWRDVGNLSNLQQKAGEWAQAEAAQRGQTLTAAQLDQRVAQIMQVPVEYLYEPATGKVPVAINQTIAKGREAELHYNPNANWTVKLNVVEQESIHSRIGAETAQWIGERMKVWPTIIDPLIGRPWFTERYNNQPSVSQAFANNIQSQLQVARALEGKSRPQVRKYRANLTTSYKLAGITDQTVLKRFTIGGAVRWEDKGAIGFYGVQQLPAIITELDVNRPVWDSDHLYLDAFASYRARLFANKVGATFQLNVRNLNESFRLQPIAANPDGSPAAYRLIDPRKFILSVTFEL